MNEHETGLTVQNPAAMAPAVQGVPAVQVVVETIWNSPVKFQAALEKAKLMSDMNMIPPAYRGKIGDCLYAIDMSERMGGVVSPPFILQNSQMVQGRFTWTGAACKTFVDICGKFKNSRYAWSGKEGQDDFGCRLVAERVSTGETVEGTLVTVGMAKAEGWYTRNGSKWKTMSRQMLCYRAATFFARQECPQILMGFQTTDEIYDIAPAAVEPEPKEAVYCEDCGQEITAHKGASVEKITAYSQKHWNMNLCGECVEKRRRNPADAPEPQGVQQDTATPPETTQDGQETIL